jgi:hypothetical protein
MVTVPLAAFEPDKSRYNSAATPEIINAVPTADGWGPLQGTTIVYGVYYLLANEDLAPLLREDGNYIAVGENFNALSGDTVLADDALGMVAARKLDATEALFVGTSTALYLFDRSQFAWEDVSGSSGPYAGTGRWSFARFGQVVYAQNGVDPEQMFDVDSDTEFSDNSTAPVAKYLAPVGDFLFRGNLDGFPARVQWSGINNPTFNTATLRLSDYQDMPTGDEVMGIVPLSGGAHIWMRSAIHGMAFALESGFVFTRAPLDETIGTSAPYSICSIGQDDYVIYTDRGFYRFKGGGFTNIGEGRVNKWFLTASDQNERENIVANIDPENNIVWFAYTNSDGDRQALGYQYNLNRWCLSTLAIQASCQARTFAYSSQPPIVEEDVLRFALINDEKRLCYLVGNNMAATLTSNELDFAPDRSLVNGAKLFSDAQAVTLVHKTTDRRGGDFRTRSAVSPSSRSGRFPLRGDGAQHKFTANISAGEDWTTATALEVDAIRTGRS